MHEVAAGISERHRLHTFRDIMIVILLAFFIKGIVF